jgi:DNA-binding beta-propeller fold protein YncE
MNTLVKANRIQRFGWVVLAFVMTITAVYLSSHWVSLAAAQPDPQTTGNYAFITLSSSNQVAVVNTTTNALVSTIDTAASGCSFPWRAAITPNSSRVYVSCRYSNNVLVIDSNTFAILHVIGPIAEADDVAFRRDGQYAFVGSRFTSQVVAVNTTTYFQLTIPTNGNTRSLAAHPFLDLIYVTSSTGEILVLDSLTFAIVGSIDVVGEPWDVVVSPDGQWLYTGDRWGQGLSVVDLSTNSLVTTLNLTGALTGLDIAPDGSKLYAGRLSGGVFVIDLSTFQAVTVAVGGQAWETAVTCDGSKLFVGSTQDFVPIVDTSTLVVVNLPMPGYGARGIAICPQYVGDGVILSPKMQQKQGALGAIITYTTTLLNETGQTDSFGLALEGHAWPTELSTSSLGPLNQGDAATFMVTVTVPSGANWYDSDVVTVTATSVTSPTVYSETAVLTTEAYAPPQIGVTPDSLSSTQLVNSQVTQTLTISNGHGVTLTYEIAERNQLSVLRVPIALPEGATSRTPPADYTARAAKQRPDSSGNVLVFQDILPWGSNAIAAILTDLQIPYVIMGSGSMATTDLRAYDLIIIASDQPEAFYQAYNANVARFTAYVQQGGVLEFHAAAWGYGSGNPNGMPLPGGGVLVGAFYYDSNYVVMPEHPIVAGVSNPFSGNSASHGYFTDLLPGTSIIATTGSSPGGQATLIEYTLGAGLVIASMQVLEHGWYYGQNTGLILENLIPYAYGQSGALDIPWLSVTPISGSIPTNESEEVAIVD